MLDQVNGDVDFKPIALEYKTNQEIDAIILLILLISIVRYLSLVKEIAIITSTLSEIMIYIFMCSVLWWAFAVCLAFILNSTFGS
jgi:hypothetical protein